MEKEENELQSFVLLDSIKGLNQPGTFMGSIISKTKHPLNEIIFSDNVALADTEISLKGLHVGVKNKKGYSIDQESTFLGGMNDLDYSIKLDPDIVKQFDESRFSASYPNVIRFLHSACLYFKSDEYEINHLEFIANEILNRPIALRRDGGLIIADRLVVDEKDYTPNFYDSIVIQRDSNLDLKMTFEPIISGVIEEFRYIIILGADNF